jgi:hypothetical protein
MNERKITINPVSITNAGSVTGQFPLMVSTCSAFIVTWKIAARGINKINDTAIMMPTHTQGLAFTFRAEEKNQIPHRIQINGSNIFPSVLYASFGFLEAFLRLRDLP